MKNRTELAKYFAEQGFTIGAEIGVCTGYYSEILCKNIPGLKLYAIDAWDLLGEYRDRQKLKKHSDFMATATMKLQPFDCTIMKAFSMDAVKDFADESLDFVYIDGNHGYRFVKDDIREWSKKVRIGGIVSGHDYYVTPRGNRGVVNAVNEYIQENGYKLLTTDWDRRNRHKDDRQPSWFFIKTHICQ